MRVILLHNPSSGEEDHPGEDFEATLSEAGHEVIYRSLQDDAWQEVLEESVDLVVIAGGDGSVRKVLTAIDSSPITAALFPVGSANNIARTLGLDATLAERLLTGAAPSRRRPFDLWSVESTWGRSRCVEAVGGGLFAEVLARAEETPADPSGPEKVDFGLRLLEESTEGIAPVNWKVHIDGTQIDDEFLGVEAMNIRELGANLRFAPGADPSDGLLDVVLVRPSDRSELLEYAAARLRDVEHPGPELEVRRGRHVVLEPSGEVRLHVDDVLPAWEQSTTTWIDIRSAETRVDVVVSDDSFAPG